MNVLYYLVAFLCSFSVSLLITPYTKDLSFKVGAVAKINERSMHKIPTGLLGGVAIFCGFFASMIVLLPFVPELHTIQFLGFTVGGIIIFVLGIFDDKYNLSAKFKLAIQIVVALIVISTGTTIHIISWPFTISFSVLDNIITLLWIVGIINAVNIIDGVDGLAAGVSAISSLCLMILCIISGSPLAVILSASLAGACLGFLPRNFYPAEIFMGDTGSTFLGYVLAVASILGVFKGYALLSIVISVLVLAFPIFDVSFAMIRRFLNGKPIMSADRGHLHHRIYDSGFSERSTVMILYALTAFSALLAIAIAIQNIYVFVVIVIFLIIMFIMAYSYRKRFPTQDTEKNKEDKKDKEDKENKKDKEDKEDKESLPEQTQQDKPKDDDISNDE